jgi:hypothetical protein
MLFITNFEPEHINILEPDNPLAYFKLSDYGKLKDVPHSNTDNPSENMNSFLSLLISISLASSISILPLRTASA